MRIAVIGARRRRQGIGEHLARFAVQAGADVRALVGTTPETTAEAVDMLERSTGHRAHGYTDFDALLDAESLDALIIASPHDTHAVYLEKALDARLHVLCEKPLAWGSDDPVATARRIADGFIAADRHLMVNTQWPLTLPTYRELYPDALATPPSSFWMRQSPSSTGRMMLLDALPHPLSLLHAAAQDPDATIEDATFDQRGEDAMRIEFIYAASTCRIAARLDLVRTPEQPRPAGYGFDGYLANRDVQMEDYELFLRSDTERIPLPDPTPMLVRSFLERVASDAQPTIDPAIIPGMPCLAALCAAYADRPKDHSA